MDEATLLRRFDLDNPAEYTPPDTPRPQPGQLTSNQIAQQVDAFLLASGALVRLNDGGRQHGQIRAFQNRTYDTSKSGPSERSRMGESRRVGPPSTSKRGGLPVV